MLTRRRFIPALMLPFVGAKSDPIDPVKRKQPNPPKDKPMLQTTIARHATAAFIFPPLFNPDGTVPSTSGLTAKMSAKSRVGGGDTMLPDLTDGSGLTLTADTYGLHVGVTYTPTQVDQYGDQTQDVQAFADLHLKSGTAIASVKILIIIQPSNTTG